jgi:hypothetical protein
MADEAGAEVWATDTIPSLPVPSQFDVLVDMGGFGFTQYGIAHNISDTNVEDYIPSFVGGNGG